MNRKTLLNIRVVLSIPLFAIQFIGAVHANSNIGFKNVIPLDSSVEASRSTVVVAGIRLVGNPETLSSINKMTVQGHDIEVTRWKTTLNLDEVMQRLSTQTPKETIAWGEAGVINMIWKSDRHSQFLTLTSLSNDGVELVLSGVGLKPSTQFSLLKNNSEHGRYALNDIRHTFNSRTLNATLLLDVKDHVTDSASFTQLYSSSQNLHLVDGEIRRLLLQDGWLIESLSGQTASQMNYRTIEASRHQQQLRIDLLAEFGKTFMHINQIGSLGLERN